MFFLKKEVIETKARLLIHEALLDNLVRTLRDKEAISGPELKEIHKSTFQQFQYAIDDINKRKQEGQKFSLDKFGVTVVQEAYLKVLNWVDI